MIGVVDDEQGVIVDVIFPHFCISPNFVVSSPGKHVVIISDELICSLVDVVSSTNVCASRAILKPEVILVVGILEAVELVEDFSM